MAARTGIRTRSEKQRLSQRDSQFVGLIGFAAAAALPWALWHRAIALIAEDFRLDVEYLVTGWTGYALIAVGLLFFIPVVASIGRSPQSRLYPRGRNAYIGWGVSLYMLGIALASQVASITQGHSAL